MPTSDRPMRGCEICGGVDNHPRHVFDATGVHEEYALKAPQEVVDKVYEIEGLDPRVLVSIVNDLNDPTVQTRHMDCCAEAGCPDGTCNEIMDRTKRAHGLKLVEAITGEKA